LTRLEKFDIIVSALGVTIGIAGARLLGRFAGSCLADARVSGIGLCCL